MKIVPVLIIALLGYAGPISASSTYVDSVFSPSLGKTMLFSIILPSDYDPMSKYPVLYLLHGGGGNHRSWLDRTNIEEFVVEYPIIVIMPDGDPLTFYVNAYTEPQDRYEDYMINDLPNYAEQKYAIDITRQSIAGLSMGGYGALVLGMRHPERFWFAASISGAIMVPRDIEILEKLPQYQFAVAAIDHVFGETPNEYRKQYDVFQLARSTSVDNLPYIFLSVGLQDGFKEIIATHNELADSLRAYGANFEFHETPGTHSYSQFGNAMILMILQSMESIMNSGGYISLAEVLFKTELEKGVIQAEELFYDLKEKNGEIAFPYYLNRSDMNSIGYKLLAMDKIDEAISIFKLNIEAYPKAANAYDSIADAYVQKGDKKLALKYSKKTLKALPDDPYETAAGKRDLKDWAEARIEKLKTRGKKK